MMQSLRQPCSGGTAATALIWATMKWSFGLEQVETCLNAFWQKNSKSSLRDVTKVFLEPRRLAVKKYYPLKRLLKIEWKSAKSTENTRELRKTKLSGKSCQFSFFPAEIKFSYERIFGSARDLFPSARLGLITSIY